LDWNDIRLIAEIGRTGSFTAAAEVLGISKPNVSRRVQFLEQTAKTRIFHRGPHGASLTPAGEQLVRQAAPILDAAVDFERTLRGMSGSGRPLIRARMTEGTATYLITPVLTGQRLGPLGVAAEKMRARLPPMRLLSTASAEPGDISLIWKSPSEPAPGGSADKISKLADIRFVPFYSADYRRQHRPIRKFADLVDHRLVTLGAYGSLPGEGWEEWNNLVSAETSEVIAVEWSSAVAFHIRGGAGVGLLPTYAPMYTDGLVPVEVAPPATFGSLWISCSEDAYKDPAIRGCYSTLLDLFHKADWMDAAA
jgi:DNA-binding transcriptional LysR family regulator